VISDLAKLGQWLRARDYRFITPTPETHRRVIARRPEAKDLRDIFGWSLPFAPGLLPSEAMPPVVREGAMLRSQVRYSSLDEQLFVHGSYPTLDNDAVFFGPDTYRFVWLLKARLTGPLGNVADVGCGSGAGGIAIAGLAKSVQLLDINDKALQFAAANARLNGVSARVAHSDVLAKAEGPLDLVIANPPYLADELGRAYRDGGAQRGTSLSARIAEEALDRLAPQGRLLLYTATPVVDGAHVLWPQLARLLRNVDYDYRELDPDVFGEELERPAYSGVERIAVVALDVFKR
jgi:release factor glutamine methyltransferase